MPVQQIVQEIEMFIQNRGGAHNQWYVGITSDINQRLFTEHGVSRENDPDWIYRSADSSELARTAETLLQNWGCDGDTGGGDTSSSIVYAYRKNSHTNP